jgi:hypothetical protein
MIKPVRAFMRGLQISAKKSIASFSGVFFSAFSGLSDEDWFFTGSGIWCIIKLSSQVLHNRDKTETEAQYGDCLET